jgi:nucleoside-diphosphate-sugar epimerase
VNIVIFGGAGYVGSNLAEYFLNKGNHVSVVDNFSCSSSADIGHLSKFTDFDFYIGPVQDISFVELVMADADVVINCVRDLNEATMVSSQVQGTQNILDCLELNQKYIHLSPSMFYSGILHDSWMYYRCAWAADDIVLGYRDGRAKNCLIIDTPMVIGPYDREYNLLGKIFINGLIGLTVEIPDPEVSLCLVSTDDVGFTVSKAIEKDVVGRIRVGSNYGSIRIKRLLELVRQNSDTEIRYQEMGQLEQNPYSFYIWNGVFPKELIVSTLKWYQANLERYE